MDAKPDQFAAATPISGAWQLYEASPNAMRLSRDSLKCKLRSWRQFAAWLVAHHPELRDIEQVSRIACEEYLRDYRACHAAITTNLRLYDLREIFRVILGDVGMEANPWNFVKPHTNDTQPRRELSRGEVTRLLAAAREVGDEWRTLFAIGAYTGMRLGDCCRLTWEQVSLERGIIQFVPHKTRRISGGRPVTIPIHSMLMAAFAAVPADCRHGAVLKQIASDFFTRRWSISKTLAAIFDAAGIETSVMVEGRDRMTPTATFHSLRHSFVSFAANAGVPLVVVQSIVGHTSTSMTRHYYHANETALREAVDAIPSFGEEGVAPSTAGMWRRTDGKNTHTINFRLMRLKRLKENSLISADEYAQLRREVLSEV